MDAAKAVNGRAVRVYGVAGALAVAGVLVLAGCGGEAASSSSSSPGSSAPSAPDGTAGASGASGGASASASPASGAGARVGPAKAGAAAVKEVAGGTLVSIELEERGAVWEAQVVSRDGTEHEVDVSASSGAVTSAHVEHEGAADRAKHRTRVAAAKIGYRDAATRLRAAVPGARVTELNLDGYRGRTVWEADVRDRSGVKHEVKLDAANGDVLVNHPSGDD